MGGMQQCPEQGRGGCSRRYRHRYYGTGSWYEPWPSAVGGRQTGWDRTPPGKVEHGTGSRITATPPGERDFVSPVRLSRITEEGGGEDSSVAIAVRVRPFSKR